MKRPSGCASRVTARSEAERFAVADQALARYDALLAQWAGQGRRRRR
jgi:hypothetical protein